MRARYDLQSMQNAARERKGECLADKYKSVNTKVPWRCMHGHEWSTRFRGILDGYWCPHCAGNAKGTIEMAKQLANQKGGDCLSIAYINGKSPLLWICQQHHTWNASYDSIKNSKTWCPHCLGLAKITIEQVHALANEMGGTCDATKFINSRTLIPWTCNICEHTWQSSYRSVRQGNWCLPCSGKQKCTIEQMQQLAESRGGSCLSTKYENQNIKLLWKCELGHEWQAAPIHVKVGTWCPYCRLKKESECRRIIERLTGKKFPKRRPDWLDGLELDGYCEEIEIAFEYQGEQHSRVVEPWHRNGEVDLASQQERDAVKEASCEDHSTDLIVIDFDVEDKLGFITRALTAIHRKRRTVLMVAEMARKLVSPTFIIADDDNTWDELRI